MNRTNLPNTLLNFDSTESDREAMRERAKLVADAPTFDISTPPEENEVLEKGKEADRAQPLPSIVPTGPPGVTTRHAAQEYQKRVVKPELSD